MQAIVCEQPFKLAVAMHDAPHRMQGEVLVRIRRVGLCGTDFHIYSGTQPYLSYPRILGHELAGEVLEADAGSAFRSGQRVTINPYLACNACIACRKGKPNCCVSLKVLGVHVDGGMREVLSLPETALIDASALSLEQAAMVEFLSVGAHAVRRASLSPQDRVLVVGAGPIGIGIALLARLAQARVTIMDKLPRRLAFARGALGFDSAVGATENASQELLQLTGGEMFDCVFDATGNRAAMCSGLQYVCHGGRYVLVSVVQGEVSFPDPEFHKRETTLLASRNALNDDFEQVIDLMVARALPAQLLHTHSLSALDAPTRVPELIADMDAVVKAIVSV